MLLLDAGFSGDGRRMVAGGQNGDARVWDVETGALLATLSHGAPVRAASLDTTGSLVVTGGGRSVKIWRSDGESSRRCRGQSP